MMLLSHVISVAHVHAAGLLFARASFPAAAVSLLSSSISSSPLVAAGLFSGLFDFAQSRLIAPLGLAGILIALGGAIFHPPAIKFGIYTAVICAVMYFLIGQASSFFLAIQNN